MEPLRLFAIAVILLAPFGAQSQECAGGAVTTHEAYQYGRFETRMRSVEGDGVVSSFFLYNVDLGCNWPEQNNEIDIEMTGNRNDSVQFTTHYPWLASTTQIVPVGFNPHDGLHDYAFEWEPGIVRWFVDGSLAYIQDSAIVSELVYPMRILMNLYAAAAPTWVGEWDPSVMPAQSAYDYVRYYAYTPGSGDAGTGDNFTLAWTDDFSSFDSARWEASEFTSFDGNYCTFVSNNVETSGGELHLAITEPQASGTIPVHFGVDVTSLNLAPGDVIYLNGGFNNWCGSCNPMSDADGDGIWEITRYLPAGNHEYLFTKNGWSEIGGAPLGSSCDFLPCDVYTNYGVTVSYDAQAVDTGTHCWGSCEDCSVAIDDVDGDGVTDEADNCLVVANPLQIDTDNDGYGNLCDPDLNNDAVVNFGDLALFKAAFLSDPGSPNWDVDADFTGDGAVNFGDLALMKLYFLAPPGPSGVVP